MAIGDRDGLDGGKCIVLAHEPSFMLGAAKVDPSTRRVEAGGRSEIIEPRMMQVLVLLARAKGDVVTRDEIIEHCWVGRIVGEDAVNRVFFRLRQLAQSMGPGTFRVETIPRVGYRLETDSAVSSGVEHAERQPFGLSRRAWGLGVVAVGAAALAGKLALAGDKTPHNPPPEAERYFALAQALQGQASYAQSQQAIAFLKEAVRIDPEYAAAWGALAIGYSSMLDWFSPRPDEKMLKLAALSAASRALALDRGNLDARFVQINLKSPYGRWSEVETGDRELLATNANYRPAQCSLANLLDETGRMDEASTLYRKLADQNPGRAGFRNSLVFTLLASGRLEEAETEIDYADRVWPQKYPFWYARLSLLLISGRPDEALRFLADKGTRPTEGPPGQESVVATVRAVATRTAADRDRAIEMLRASASSLKGDLAIAAIMTAFVGDLDLSFSMYEGYFFDRGPWKAGPLDRRYTSGLFKAETALLRRDARFPALVREIGLDRYWRMASATPSYRLA